MPATEKKATAPLPPPRRRNNLVRRGGTAATKTALSLRPGRCWKSFEQFRAGGQSQLAALGAGEIGQLLTREGGFRILREADFQQLYGLARDVERTQRGVNVIIKAAQAAGKHQDEATISALLEVVMYVNIPALPVRAADDPGAALYPEGAALDEDDLDDIILDPAAVPRPYTNRSADE